MKTKYIIEVEDKPFELLSEDGFTSEKLYRVKGFNSLVFDWNGLNMLTPYTEPDMEKVREEAYAEGYKEGMQLSIDDAKLKEAYQRGLNDAWDAAKKTAYYWIWSGGTNEAEEIFGTDDIIAIFKSYSASECIEKIRQYEQGNDRQARIEYNFDEIKDVLETTAKECNVSLDEIAEVLAKMKEK